LKVVRHGNENTRVLRRLLVVGLAGASLCAPALAHAGTVAIFYYPWYATPATDGRWQHWDQNGHRPPADLYSRFFPAVGPYSSSDPAVVDLQMTEIAAAGINEVVVSWWGRGSVEDRRLPLVASDARRHGLVVAIHLEPYPDRSPANVVADLAYIATLGVRDFDGIYTYDFITYRGASFGRICAEAHAVHLLCAPSVGPGYDGLRAGEPPPIRPRRNGVTYDELWAAAIAARPDVVTITSFNEWGEGTQIEPARPRHGYRGYDGAWSLTGAAAQTAYLDRTAYWAARFRGLR
jgi:Glycosyl hydrolase family 99